MEEKYIVSARKYRPQTFASVVGQKVLTGTLRNAVLQDRVAQAYLFCGPRGVGKTSCARIFAKTINCEHLSPEGEACGECASCRDFARGYSYNVIELDAASNNGVDQMRQLTEQVNIPPQVGRYRVFIIDEVHMLSQAAFNAFLKTLEEPPSYAVFILATTEKHKVIPTILSRCQVYDFARITTADIAEHLAYVAGQEGMTAEPEALEMIARKADGGLRDALSIFDQVAAASGGNVTAAAASENLNMLDYEYYFRFVDAFCRNDVSAALLLYKEVRDKGFDSLFFVNGLAQHVRDLLVAADPRTADLIEAGEHARARYVEQAKGFRPQWYYDALKLLSDCDLNYRMATNRQLLVELTLIRLSQLSAPREEAVPREALLQPAQPVSGATTPSASSAPQAPRPQQRPAQSAAPMSAAASRPAPQAVRPAAHHATARIRQHTMSIKGDSAPQASAPGPRGGGEGGEAPIPDDAVGPLWGEFMKENSDLTIVVNAMRASQPARVDATTWAIAVDNQAQVSRFEEDMPRIADFFRTRLHNDKFRLEVRLRAPRERERALSPQDLLKEMIQENPALASLLETLDAELA